MNNEEPDWSRFVGIELSACQEEKHYDNNTYLDSSWDTVDNFTYNPDRPVIFTLYGVSEDGCAEALHDFKFVSEAIVLANNVVSANPGYIMKNMLFQKVIWDNELLRAEVEEEEE